MSLSATQGSIGSRSTKVPVRTYKICLFRKESFQGTHLELKGECRNVCEKGLERVGSLSVAAGPWVGFEQHNLMGEMFILEKGEFPRWDSWSNSSRSDQLRSLRPVRVDSLEPNICLFEGVGFQGRKMEVCDEDIPSLWSYDFQDRVCSIQVTGGTWVGYQYPGYRGSQFLFENGAYKHWNSWGAAHPQIQSLRRVRDLLTHQRDGLEAQAV
ncbi:beta-crystallin B1-like [Conger conger]|uniref:beta-crystallin B1-like n=1 Tax=Conger conger TaxID=82655 RepID=UPI002A59F3DD|nr:beta-crystallin B1-like [Conger conger]